MFYILVSYLSLCSLATNAFVHHHQSKFGVSSKRASLHFLAKKDGDNVVVNQQAFSVGSFVEFNEKKRVHTGKILSVEHKSSGGARYDVLDSEGKKYSIADKQISYHMPSPNSPGQATKLFEEFSRAQDIPLQSLQTQLDVSPELVLMAWEEVLHSSDDETNKDHLVTPDSFIELIHSHAASAMERYLAWKLLKTDMAHIFFKEIKDHGRVVAFKAKTEKAVEAAKQVFCRSHSEDNEICFV